MDFKTVFIMLLLTFIFSSVVIALLWPTARIRYKGMVQWCVQFALFGAGSVLIALRGQLPDLISILAGNALIFFAMLLIVAGFEQFFGLPSTSRFNFALFGLTLLVFSWFTLIQPNLRARMLIFIVYFLVVQSQTLFLLTRRLSDRAYRLAAPMRLIFGLYVLAQLYRLYHTFTLPAMPRDFLTGTPFETRYMLIQIFLTGMFSVCLIQMFVQRLTLDIIAEETKFNTIFSQAPYAIVLTRLSDAVITDINEHFEQVSGYTRSEVIGSTALQLGIWADIRDRQSFVDTLQSGAKVNNTEVRLRNKAGEMVPVLYSAVMVNINHQDYLLSSLKNISDIVDLRGKLEHLATHDTLTLLPNRLLFYDRFEIALAQAKRSGTHFVVAMVDIDDFKQVNDQLGHTVGDLLLIEISGRISRFIRQSDTVARFGGDEFVILVTGLDSRESAAETLERIIDLYQQPFILSGLSIQTTISIGCALFPDDADSMAELLSQADKALYHAKRHGKNNVQFYEVETGL